MSEMPLSLAELLIRLTFLRVDPILEFFMVLCSIPASLFMEKSWGSLPARCSFDLPGRGQVSAPPSPGANLSVTPTAEQSAHLRAQEGMQLIGVSSHLGQVPVHM